MSEFGLISYKRDVLVDKLGLWMTFRTAWNAIRMESESDMATQGVRLLLILPRPFARRSDEYLLAGSVIEVLEGPHYRESCHGRWLRPVRKLDGPLVHLDHVSIRQFLTISQKDGRRTFNTKRAHRH